MCFVMQALRNLWKPSIFPLLCGLYGGEWIDISVPSLVTTSLKSLFLNSVPLSVKVFTLPPNGQAMWFLYAVTTSSAVFVFNATHHINPVTIQQAVNAKCSRRMELTYQIHTDEIHSRHRGMKELSFKLHILLSVQRAHWAKFAVLLDILFDILPVENPFHCCIGSWEPIMS